MGVTFEERRTEEEKQADAILKERVLAGMALLEESYGPDWVEHIDLEKLHMADMNRCVLGQLYGEDDTDGRTGYEYGIEVLGVERRGSFTFGFDIEDVDQSISANSAAYAELKDVWAEEIEAARSVSC
jgi:hypothetical protein